MKRWICLLLCLALTLSLLPATALAAPEQQDACGSDQAPEGYTPTPAEPAKKGRAGGAEVLLIQDNLPWDSHANTTVLDSLGISYEIAGTQDFVTNVDLTKYKVVIFPNDQTFKSYANYRMFREYLELFAELGGVIIFGACDKGWSDGTMDEALPGGVKKGNEYVLRNYISDPNHPIITGELSDNIPLLRSDLVNKYTSHVYFLEESFPPGTHVLMRDEERDRPTLIEYPLGNGRIIASGLTWEHAWDHAGTEIVEKDGTHTNVICGQFAKKALDDLYLYAIRVSNIQVNDLNRLRDYRIDDAGHYIIVSDEWNYPLENATVKGTVNSKNFNLTTNADGMVRLPDLGPVDVTISYPSFETREFLYEAKAGEARLFFLPLEPMPRLPYFTMAEADGTFYDFLSQKVYYQEGSRDSLTLRLSAEWHGKTKSEYVIYQKDASGKEINKKTTKGNVFYLTPGRDFTPGLDIRIRAYATDGTASLETRIGIKVVADDGIVGGDPTADKIENLTGFTLFRDTEGSLNDSQALNILPDTWNLKMDLLPIEVDKKYDAKDGSSTIRGAIGFVGGKITDDLFNNDNDEAKWETFKSKINKAREYASDRNKLLEEYKDKMADAAMSYQFKMKIQAMGYFEVKLNAFGDVVKFSGGILVKSKAEYAYGSTFMLGPVPVYYEIKMAAKLDIKAGLQLKFVADRVELGLEGEIKLTFPELTLGGGVGVYGVAQVGVEGKGGVEMQLAPEWKGTLKMEANFVVKVLFLADFSWQLDSRDIPLWPSRKSAMSGLRPEEAVIALTDCSYKSKRSDWYGGDEVLQEWVMPDTMPELCRVGDQLVALFQANNGVGEDHIELMYSVYDGYYWSEPEPVAPDGTNDLFFSAAAAGDSLYVLWQNLSRQPDQRDAETLVADMTESSEIYSARWDAENECFTAVTRLTNNDCLDMMPRLYADGTRVAAAWVRSAENEAINGESPYEIYGATLSGSKWSTAKKIATVEGYVSDLAVGYAGSTAHLAYVSDGTVYSGAWSKTVKAVSGEAAVGGVRFEGGRFLWVEDGVLRAYTGSGSAKNLSDPEAAVIGADARYLRSEGKQGVVWTVGDTLYASLLNGSKLSEPVALYTLYDADRFAYWDAELADDGTWQLFADAADEEKSSLVFAQVWPFTDLELQYACADPAKRSGKYQTVEISVVNRGESPVTSVDVGIFGGPIDFDKSLTCNILPGETWNYSVKLDVSGLTGPEELVVYAESAEEYDFENNYDYVTVGALDASLDLEYYSNGDTVVVTARARNAGPGPAHATITVQEDDEEGIVLDMKNLGEIATDEDVLYLYEFDLREVNFAGARTKNYCISLETLEEDYNPENNRRYIVIYNDRKASFTDVPADAYYTEPVNWAVEYGITNGTSPTTFSPDSTCTRGQIVTFLWRASGCPAPTSTENPFRDVAPDAYYYQAVLWAVENGVTNGTSPTTFSPNSTCTRAQVVTFLWRANGASRLITTRNPFADVSPGAYFGSAVLWAVENGITNGVSATSFAPGRGCTRAQVVTFLYRAVHREEPAEDFDPARYELVAENVTWQEAMAAARAKGGRLVSIDSPEEYRYLLGRILDEGMGGRSFHLGGRRDPNGSSYHWVNADNTHLIGPALNGPDAWCQTLWQVGEPSLTWNGIPEEVMIAYFSEKEGRWVWYDGQKDDIVATRDYGYIIEYDP